MSGVTEKSSLDKTNSQGDGFIYYPSGRVAVVVCKGPAGQMVTFMADTEKNQILATFNHLGVGGVQYTNGTPWLVVTEEGWSVSEKSGASIERGKFPRKKPEPVTCQASVCLVVKFQDRQNIKAHFVCEDVHKEFDCGEKLRRTESYESKVMGKRSDGRLQLDISSIRQRQKEVGLSGSVYVPPGPHHFSTEQPGVGALKAQLRTLTSTSSTLSSTVKELQSLDARLSSINLLAKPMYGTARLSSTSSTSVSPGGTARLDATSASAALDATARSGGDTMASSTGRRLPTLVPADFGAPPMSDSMRRFARKLGAPGAVKKQEPYKGRRKRLEQMPMADIAERVMGGSAPQDTLLVLCVLADWAPACFKLEQQLMAANHALGEESQGAGASMSGRVKMYKVDASEGNWLQKKYDFRTVPMLLMYYEGKLVRATNSLSSAASIKAGALEALAQGRRKQFLPEAFSFRGQDNCQLDYITESWSMLA